jgi:hypothetical protein
MLLKELTLANFCQHKQRVFDVSPGLVGVLGPNGRGKTNMSTTGLMFALTGQAVEASGRRWKREELLRHGEAQYADEPWGHVEDPLLVLAEVRQRQFLEQHVPASYSLDALAFRTTALNLPLNRSSTTRLFRSISWYQSFQKIEPWGDLYQLNASSTKNFSSAFPAISLSGRV